MLQSQWHGEYIAVVPRGGYPAKRKRYREGGRHVHEAAARSEGQRPDPAHRQHDREHKHAEEQAKRLGVHKSDWPDAPHLGRRRHVVAIPEPDR